MAGASKHDTADLDELQREHSTVHHQYLIALGVLITLLIVGATTYHHMLHLTWVNAFYFCTTTLATVGYGDITPTTDASKIFTIFYIIVGIGVFTTFASLFVKHQSLRKEIRHTKRHGS